jgi:hypothetical protein
MSTQSEDPGRVRTSDAEREQVATILRAAVSEGRLSLEEGDERLARVYQAKYRDELGPLTADLPDGGWDALHRTPEALAGIRRRLRMHAGGAVLIGGVLVGLWVLSGAHFFWPLIPLLVLAFSVLRHRRWAWYAAQGRGPWGGPWGRGPWGQGPWERGPWGQGPWGHHGPWASSGAGPWNRR